MDLYHQLPPKLHNKNLLKKNIIDIVENADNENNSLGLTRL